MGKRRRKNKPEKIEFSKTLLIQESALIWVLTLASIVLAFYCVACGYTGSLPWITAMVGLPWSAYGVIQIFYYQKSTKENTKNGIKFESVMAEVNSIYGSSVKYNQIFDTTSQEKTIEPDIIIPEQDNFVEEYIPNLDYGI